MISNRLIKLRKERQMTQVELAKVLSVSKFTISLYENRNCTPTEKVLIKIAKIFDVSIDYLVGLTDEPYPYDRGNDRIIRIPTHFSADSKSFLSDLVEFMEYKYESDI